MRVAQVVNAVATVIALTLVCTAPLSAQRGGKADTATKGAAVKAAPKPDTTKKGAAAKAAPKPDTTKKGAVAKAPPKPDSAKHAAGKADSAAATGLSERGTKGQMSIMREVFTYSPGGRRDPMVSLMTTSDIRPLPTEVEVIAIIYDEEGPNSEAVLRNLTDKKKLYRLRLGQTLGRMKVAQITRREVIFTLDEFGFSRQIPFSVKPDTSAGRSK